MMNRPDTFISRFLKQAELQPDRPAAADIRGTYTYGELNRRSAYLAEQIMTSVEGKGRRVALLLPRTKDYFVAQIAVLRAGCAVVPVEEDYPAERVRIILEDAGCSLCITVSEMARKASDCPVLIMEEIFPVGISIPLSDPMPDLSDPDAEGYIFYTSGSTGKPKGVVHLQEMLNFIPDAFEGVLPIDGNSRSLAIAGFSVIGILQDITPLLIKGGSVYLADENERKDFDRIWELFRTQKITGMFMPPRMYRSMRSLYGEFPLDYVIVGSEKFVYDGKPDANVWENYGASEACPPLLMHHPCEDISPSLGKPCRGVGAYLLDEDGTIIDRPDVIGELCVSGIEVAVGYQGMPVETAQRFAKDPFHPDRRMYRTGDLMAYDHEGNLVFHGRKDRMVKIRGFRVELSEIEETMRNREGIYDAAAVHVSGDSGEHLCCYYTGQIQPPDELKAWSEQYLPEYMVPDYFVHLEKMPVNERSKVDYPVLQAMPLPREETVYIPPQTAEEKRICEAYAKVLGRPQTGLSDDFFEMGGSSLECMELVALIHDPRLDLKTIYECRTPAAIVRAMEEKKIMDYDALNQEALMHPQPLTPYQTYYVDYQLYSPDGVIADIPYFCRMDRGDIDIERLTDAVNQTLRYHPSYSTVFLFAEDGTLMQRVEKEAVKQAEVFCLPEAEILPHALNRYFRPFRKLTGEALYRCALYVSEEYVYILLDIHHTISDGVSLQNTLRTIFRFYEGETPEKDYYYAFLQKTAEDRQSEEYRTALAQYRRKHEKEGYVRYPHFDHFQPGNIQSKYYTDSGHSFGELFDWCRKTGFSMTQLLTAVAAMTLSRYENDPHVTIETLYNGRNENWKLFCVGNLLSGIPVTLDIEENPDFRTLLADVRQQIVEGVRQSDCSFAMLQADPLSTERFRVIYDSGVGVPENMPAGSRLIDLYDYAMQGNTSVFFVLVAEGKPQTNMELMFTYNGVLYSPESAVRFADIFIDLLNRVLM